MTAGFLKDLRSRKYTDEEVKGAIAMAVNDMVNERLKAAIPLVLKAYSEQYNKHIAEQFEQMLTEFRQGGAVE